MKEKFGQWWLDVAKYVFTVVILATVFNDVVDKVYLYVVGLLLVVLCVCLGLLLIHSHEKDDDKNKKKGHKK